jgi:hypothetical protein
MAFKYRVPLSNGFIEHPTLELATAEAEAQGVSVGDIQEIEWVPGRPYIAPVTPRQMRLALLASGVTAAAVESAIGSLSEPTKSQAMIAWEYSTLFLRENPLVNMLGQMLGWSETQLDNLWLAAAVL